MMTCDSTIIKKTPKLKMFRSIPVGSGSNNFRNSCYHWFHSGDGDFLKREDWGAGSGRWGTRVVQTINHNVLHNVDTLTMRGRMGSQ